ncbi:hypothetical protein [Paenibacillus fonticola]|uniref:hypothetical protein n=1 Tax=Paenibacillus fonticola TaxID=379896 RepID=UPI0012FB2619
MSFNELTPELLHKLIDRIEIKADGSPSIFYRLSNPSAYSLLLTINAHTPHVLYAGIHPIINNGFCYSHIQSRKFNDLAYSLLSTLLSLLHLTTNFCGSFTARSPLLWREDFPSLSDILL